MRVCTGEGTSYHVDLVELLDKFRDLQGDEAMLGELHRMLGRLLDRLPREERLVLLAPLLNQSQLDFMSTV